MAVVVKKHSDCHHDSNGGAQERVTVVNALGNRRLHPTVSEYEAQLVAGNFKSLSLSGITSKLSERPLKLADQKTERAKVLNPEYNIFRDQPIAGASPLIVIRRLTYWLFGISLP